MDTKANASSTSPRTYLNTLLAVGRQREKDGTYPRVRTGYMATCSQCGREAAFYAVAEGPEREEWAGFRVRDCMCNAPFAMPASHGSGMA